MKKTKTTRQNTPFDDIVVDIFDDFFNTIKSDEAYANDTPNYVYIDCDCHRVVYNKVKGSFLMRRAGEVYVFIGEKVTDKLIQEWLCHYVNELNENWREDD